MKTEQDYLRDILRLRKDNKIAALETEAATLREEVRELREKKSAALAELAKWFERAEAAEAAKEAAEREVAEIAAAIGCDDYLDPPDGGGVSLAEQVRRMRRSLQMAKGILTKLEAAEREVAEIAAAIGCDDYLDPPDGGGVSLAEQVRRMRRSLQMAKGILTKLEAAEQRCAELAKVLRKIEWCLGDDMNPGPTCPWCMEDKPHHHPDCELAAALAAASPAGDTP